MHPRMIIPAHRQRAAQALEKAKSPKRAKKAKAAPGAPRAAVVDQLKGSGQ